MQELAAQWPLLAGFLVLAGALLRVVQSLYEARLRDWQDFAAKSQERAEAAEAVLREQTDLLERQARVLADMGKSLEDALRELERRRPPRA